LVIFALLSVVAACKKSSVKLYPVKGKVLYKGQPAEGAQVVFRPAADNAGGASTAAAAAPNPYGDVKADGSFSLHTEFGEGAPAGEYMVLITWYMLTNPDEPQSSKSKLPAKYADQSNPILKATVKEGSNELPPFDLK
jgi:hypothetical protein